MGVQKFSSEKSSPFFQKYELGEILGCGAYGQVWSCRDRETKEDYACKVVVKDKTAGLGGPEARGGFLETEIQILETLKGQHEGIVQLKEVLETDRAVQVVQEKCHGGNLFELLKSRGKLPEESAKLIFLQLASALEFCHSKGIAHRDIKPENILLDSPATCLYSTNPPLSALGVPPVNAKLADFGLAVVLSGGGTTKGMVGTKYYRAPEVISGKSYGRRVDVWGLGVVLCTMLTGKFPFAGRTCDDDEGLSRAILRGEVDFGSWVGVSDEAKDLVRRMLEVEPQKRLRVFQLNSHPWCASGQVLGAGVSGSSGDVTFPPSAKVAASRNGVVGAPLLAGRIGAKSRMPCAIQPVQVAPCDEANIFSAPPMNGFAEGKGNQPVVRPVKENLLQRHGSPGKIFFRGKQCASEEHEKDHGHHHRKLLGWKISCRHVLKAFLFNQRACLSTC